MYSLNSTIYYIDLFQLIVLLVRRGNEYAGIVRTCPRSSCTKNPQSYPQAWKALKFVHFAVTHSKHAVFRTVSD